MRYLISSLLAFALAACQFTPVYGPGGSGEIIRNRIYLAEPTNRIEFEILSRLEDRIGRGSIFALDYSLNISNRSLGIEGSDGIARVNLVGTLVFTVTEVATDIVVQAGDVSTFTSFATTSSYITTETALRDAEDRLAVALADQLVTSLISNGQTW